MTAGGILEEFARRQDVVDAGIRLGTALALFIAAGRSEVAAKVLRVSERLDDLFAAVNAAYACGYVDEGRGLWVVTP